MAAPSVIEQRAKASESVTEAFTKDAIEVDGNDGVGYIVRGWRDVMISVFCHEHIYPSLRHVDTTRYKKINKQRFYVQTVAEKATSWEENRGR